jgi:hypothetical protein
VRIGAVEIIAEPYYDEQRKRSVPGTAKVAATGRCVANGTPYLVSFLEGETLDERIAVKYNRGMNDDAIVGKAKARVMKELWRLVTNSAIAEPEDSDDATIIDSSAAAPDVSHDPNANGLEPQAADAQAARDAYLSDLDTAESKLSGQLASEAYERYASKPNADTDWATAEREKTIARINDARRKQ